MRPFTSPKLFSAFFAVLVTLWLPITGTSQTTPEPKPEVKGGEFFIYWGWNRSAYTTSEIRFTGEQYDFTLHDVVAKDRQSKFGIDPYLNPPRMTIPQYNLRIGYYLNAHHQVSIGTDHMKYVVQQNQVVGIDGEISEANNPFAASYSDKRINLSPDFLLFEHTDGLNYANVEWRYTQRFLERKKIFLEAQAGAGLGILLPRTNTTLMGRERYDEFHLAGYGSAAVVALNFTFFKYFFIQTELKGGFINMPDIRTTSSKADRAKQHFFFYQYNILFGGRFRLGR